MAPRSKKATARRAAFKLDASREPPEPPAPPKPARAPRKPKPPPPKISAEERRKKIAAAKRRKERMQDPAKPVGRPRHMDYIEIHTAVRNLASTGAFGAGEIARILGISEQTLYRHYRDDLEAGRGMRAGQVVDMSFRMALGTDRIDEAPNRAEADPGMVRFLMERVVGLKPAAQRVEVKHQYDFSRLTDDDLAEYGSLLDRIAALPVGAGGGEEGVPRGAVIEGTASEDRGGEEP